jgi:hypothetical protein
MNDDIYEICKNNVIFVSLCDRFQIVMKNNKKYIFKDDTHYLESIILKTMNKIGQTPNLKEMYIAKLIAQHPKLGQFMKNEIFSNFEN